MLGEISRPKPPPHQHFTAADFAGMCGDDRLNDNTEILHAAQYIAAERKGYIGKVLDALQVTSESSRKGWLVSCLAIRSRETICSTKSDGVSCGRE